MFLDYLRGIGMCWLLGDKNCFCNGCSMIKSNWIIGKLKWKSGLENK